MRIFAFFLPQFHEIPENNKWWGKGFTEWTNIKKGKHLSLKNHKISHPLNNNYYNLLDKKTVLWQTSLMQRFGVDGLIYYHYYFDGKLLLEKPAENLLKWTDIDQPFFFCWGNHTWIRSWNGTKEILIEQTYGDIHSWEKHFQYLLEFFKDRRYEKIGGKPVFMVFKSPFEEELEIMKYFDKRCKECGFKGIYWISSCFSKADYIKQIERYKVINSWSIFLRQPNIAKALYTDEICNHNYFFDFFHRLYIHFRRDILKKRLYIYRGDVLIKLINSRIETKPKVFQGLFFSWDNTPRHGSNGYVITPISKKWFFRYMNRMKNEEFLFINAWNEWCEGMVLEPSEENGYKYLRWIKEFRRIYNR